jgi:hypothetical protein
MPEIEEELIVIVESQNIKLKTSAVDDVVTLSGLNFSNSQAATLAWLINHGPGTLIQFQIKKV